MKRGEVWTSAGGPDYAGKPRPVVILQDDRLGTTASITTCGFTTTEVAAPIVRPLIVASGLNGLQVSSRLMVDKITTMPRARMGTRIGQLSDRERREVDGAIMVFLGLSD